MLIVAAKGCCLFNKVLCVKLLPTHYWGKVLNTKCFKSLIFRDNVNDNNLLRNEVLNMDEIV